MESLRRDTNGSDRQLTAEQLEVAVLDRTRPQQRKFKRVPAGQVARLLEETPAPESTKDETRRDEEK